MVIRPAVPEDATGLAWVRQLGWKSAYRGIMPDEVLDKMDYVKEKARWVGIIGDNPAERCLFCAEMDGQIVGFCSGGPDRDLNPDYDSELCGSWLWE